ncbi:exo-alpha-sialidase [Variovorax boronicumulans]|nr:exo-alpha-sialidase [Variovorax boronicumulans]
MLLKVVSTRPISLLNPKWQQITLISAQGVRHEVPDLTPMAVGVFGGSAVPTESLHFGRLPPGEYEFSSAGSIGPGPGLLLALIASDHASLEKQVPRFKVEAGRLANLGTVVFSPSTGDKEPAQIILLGGARGTAESMRALTDDSRNAPVLRPGGGWLQMPTDEAQAISRARELVSMLSPIGSRSGARMVAGSHLGEIVERVAPGRWTSEPLDTLARVSFASCWKDATCVAGSEFGRYAIKRPGASWEAHRLSNEYGQVASIQDLSEGRALFVVTDRLKGARVLVQDQLGNDEAVPKELSAGIQDTDEAKLPVLMLDHPDALLMARNVPGFRRESLVTRVDKQSLRVTTNREKFWVSNWQVLQDGEIAVTRMNGMTTYFTSSKDGGKTWVSTERTVPIGTYWRDQSRALGIQPTPGFSTVSNQVTQTTDGGKTWTPLGQPFRSADFAARIVYADDQEILAEDGKRVFSSLDAGKTWTPRFPRVGANSSSVAGASRLQSGL